MTSRATSVGVGALTCMVASAAMVTIHLGDAGAADECLAAPKKDTPAGQHWFYRIDRATKRHCWYLNADTGASTVARSTVTHRAAKAAPAAAEREVALTPSVANGLAEMPSPQAGAETDAKAAPAASTSPVVVTGDSGGPVPQGQQPQGQQLQAQPGDTVFPNPTQSVFPNPTQSVFPNPTQPVASDPPAALAGQSAPPATTSSDTPALATVSASPDTKNADAAPLTPPAPATNLVPAAKMEAIPASRANMPPMAKVTSLSAFFVASFGALIFVTVATGLSYVFTARGRRRQVQADGRLSGLPDWSPEPFQVPSLFEPVADDAPRAASVPVGVPRFGRSAGRSEDDARQIEQLLTRAVRRSETLRGRMEDLSRI